MANISAEKLVSQLIDEGDGSWRVNANLQINANAMSVICSTLEPVLRKLIRSGAIRSNIYDDAHAHSLARDIMSAALAKLGVSRSS